MWNEIVLNMTYERSPSDRVTRATNGQSAAYY
jgi:hypothetical protein